MNRCDARQYVDDLLAYAISLGRKPGTWYMYYNHVYGVALIAEKIAGTLGYLDAERAYVTGLLHDVGKFDELRYGRFHGLCGYERLKDIDKYAARIALTHTFFDNMTPLKSEVERIFFGSQDDYNQVVAYLKKHPANDYDRLIQLCDCLANCHGLVTIEQRAEEYALRHCEPQPWHIYEGAQKMKAYFDEKLGKDVYLLFAEIPLDFMLHAGKDEK